MGHMITYSESEQMSCQVIGSFKGNLFEQLSVISQYSIRNLVLTSDVVFVQLHLASCSHNYIQPVIKQLSAS